MSFVHRSFYELNPDTVFKPSPHIEAIASKLEACRRGEIRRLIINLPPRHLKSHTASIAFVAWLLGHNPAEQVICASYGQDLADKLARDCRIVMSSGWYQQLFSTRMAGKNSVSDFSTTKQGFRMSTSVGGVLTGRGANFIIIDDPLKPDEALSESQRKAVNEWYDNTLLMPLADVGILYQALNSQIVPGQRVQLEVLDQQEESGAPDIEVNFEILERIDPASGVAPLGRTWGPYKTTTDTGLELHSPFSNVYVDAPVTVLLGDGIVQQIGAPTELDVQDLLISARQVLVQSGGAEGPKELLTVSLIAKDADASSVQNVLVRDGASLSVSWPNAKAYPWNSYVAEIPGAASEGVEFMRRRLRKILTAFRSHSKGALVRLAAKIESNRMTKDARGVALLERLISDKILLSFDGGKFYQLDPDAMGRTLGVGYHDLAQSRFTPESDSYLMDVLGRVKE